MKSEFEKWFDGEYSNYGVGYKKYYKNETDSYVSDFVDDRYSAFQAGHQHQQSKVDELQRRNQMLNDNIKEQGQKLVYQNKVIETQDEKLIDLRDEKAELKKRVGAATAKWISIISILTTTESNVPDVIYQQLDELHDALCGYELWQALKCGEESKPSDKNKPA